MSKRKRSVKFTAEQKVAILREHLPKLRVSRDCARETGALQGRGILGSRGN